MRGRGVGQSFCGVSVGDDEPVEDGRSERERRRCSREENLFLGIFLRRASVETPEVEWVDERRRRLWNDFSVSL